MLIKLTPKAILSTLLLVIFGLLCANLLGIILDYGFNHGRILGLVKMFNFNSPDGIPELYSIFANGFCAILSTTIFFNAKKDGEKYSAWLNFSIVLWCFAFLKMVTVKRFIYISSFVIHRKHELIFNFIFVIILLCLFWFGFTIIKLIFSMPHKIKILLFFSFGIFATGAFGFDSIGDLILTKHGSNSILFAASYTIEGFLEMVGNALLTYSLIEYINIKYGHLTILIH